MYKRGAILYSSSKGTYREKVDRRNGHVGKVLILCQERKTPQSKQWHTVLWMLRYVSLDGWKIETFNKEIPALEFYNIQLKEKASEQSAFN